MHRLSDPAIEAILNEWDIAEYDPPNTDIREWNRAVETLCDTYGIPDSQRPQCAARFARGELRTELEKVLKDAREKFGPISWVRFTTFMVAFDRDFRESWEKLPFYKKHPKLTGATLGVTGSVILAPIAAVGFLAGSILLAPVAAVGVLTAAGFASGGIVAGSLAATVQSIVYGGATGGLFSLLQSAGATAVLPSVRTMFEGATMVLRSVGMFARAVKTVAGIVVRRRGRSVVTDEILSGPLPARGHGPGPGVDDGDDDSDPPSYNQAVPREHVFTAEAFQAIVKSWDIGPYNPPGTDGPGWLSRICKFCEEYEVPLTQRTLCAMHHMRADCQEAADAAECYNMAWDEFTTWFLKYDGLYVTSELRSRS